MTGQTRRVGRRSRTVRAWLVALLARTVLLAALWWALVEGDAGMYVYGLVLVPLAVAVSLIASRPRAEPSAGSLPGRAVAAVTLVAWFLGRSVVGGVDVARRALARPVDLEPGFVEHRLRLPAGAARVLVVQLMNLMPGSLSAELDDDRVLLHSLHTELPVLEQIEELESRIARVLGRRLDDPSAG